MAGALKQVVRFQKNSSGTNGVTQDVNLSFTPKCFKIFSSGGTANNTFEDHHQIILGYGDGTNNVCIATVSDDADAVAETARIIRDDSCFCRLLEAMSGSVVIQSRCSGTIGTNKVTLTWTINDTDATYLTLVAFGGDDITNATAGVLSVGTTGTGLQSYTPLSYTVTEGQGILFCATSDQTVTNSGQNGSAYGAGFAVSNTKRYCMAGVAENGADPMDVWNFQSNTRCLINLDCTTGSIDGYADFNAWVTNGFQLDIENAFASSSLKFIYLVIKGGTWDAGSDTAPTGTPPTSKNHSVSVGGKTIRGVGIYSISDTTLNSTISYNTQSIGVSDGTNESFIGSGDNDNVATSESARRNGGSNIVGVPNVSATASSSTFYTAGSLTSFGTNQFTVNYSAHGSSSAYYIGWFVLADYTSPPPPPLDVQCKEFTFSCNTSTGNQTILSNCGFAVKGYMLVCVITSSDGAFQSHHNIIIGMSDGTNQANTSASAEDNQTTSDAWRTHTNQSVLEITDLTSESAVDGIATHSSFGTGDDIIINWSDAPSSAWKVYGLAWGGDGLSCELTQRSVGRSTAGTQSYTTSMSDPEFGLFMGTVSSTTPSSTAGNGTFGFGVALSTSKRGLVLLDSVDGSGAADTYRLLSNARCVGILDGNTGGGGSSPAGESWSADFYSWNSNGFTLDIIDPPSSSNTVFYSMVFKTDGRSPFDCGIVAKRTSTGTTVINTASGVGDIQGLCIFSDDAQNSLTVQAHARISIGLASSISNRGCVWSGDEDAADPMVSAKRSENNQIFRMSDEAATATSSTTQGLADLSNLGRETFTLNYSVATATAADLIWFVIGNALTTQEYTRPISETSVSVGAGSIAIAVGRIKSLSETGINVSDSIGTLETYNKIISETSINISDQLDKYVGRARPISESSINISDDIQTQEDYNIPISEPSNSVSDQIDRTVSITRLISEASISVSDQIVRFKLFTKGIIETVKIAYALLTFKNPSGSDRSPI